MKNINNSESNLQEVIVQANEKIAPSTYLLAFTRFFDFIPGQVVNVQLDKDIPPRMYSIASSNNNDMVKLLYKTNPLGALTPRLSQLKKNDKLLVSKPFGNFIATREESVFVATGTGVAPFASMFFSGWMKNKILIHGSRTVDEFYFQSEFIRQLGGNYIRCCSSEKNKFTYYGRVTQYLKEMIDLPVDRKYYLCGSAEMVVDVRDILLSRGISFNQILSEIYF